jgi:alkylation response protein AidB-like acyl-CoA dehydrogenase
VRDDVLGQLLRASPDPAECPDVARWWPAYRALAATWKNPMDRAIVGGFGSDRVGWAFAGGYQCALAALFPSLPEDALVALCVTEEEGNHPRAIRTTLRRAASGWRLDGAKRWTTLGPQGALFLVLARDTEVESERPALKVARVPLDAPGVRIEPMAPTRFVPEVPHARLAFDAVPLAEDALLPGDGWSLYAKPFRTVEDAHVNAAVLGYLVREARRLAWPRGWVARAAALLLALRALAAEDPSRPQTHVALDGILATAGALFAEAATHWDATLSDAARARWLRDRELLNVASTARAQRSAGAWRQFGGS